MIKSRSVSHSLPRLLPPRLSFSQCQAFRTSASGRQEETYYQTLGLEQTASYGSIKKQYFHLSKIHHPDRNPSDPTASSRFMRISEAYATLSNERKRSLYDRTIAPTVQSKTSGNPIPRGSHSSASTPYGARPASGLSKRRTQFRGPPPSFFKNGGGSGRSARADHFDPTSAEGKGGGMGFGQGFQGDQVPHFDREGHLRTQASHDDRVRRRRVFEEDNFEAEGGSGDVLGRFLLVSGIVGLAFVPVIFFGNTSSKSAKRMTVDNK